MPTPHPFFPHSQDIKAGLKEPYWWRAKKMPVPQEISWNNHDAAVLALRTFDATVNAPPKFSLLDLKIALAEAEMQRCCLCPHRCDVNRLQGQTGYCGVAETSSVHWDGVLYGEERELVPSHEVFLSGCTMRCAFCYSHEHIENPHSGRQVIPLELARRVEAAHTEGATNWNVVGGEPTVHLLNILRALRELEAPQPLVWNSNMYMEPVTLKLLDGVTDVFLGDIHFGNDICSRRLGRIPRYLPSITAAFRMAIDSGADVIIRHLLMPGHVECCGRAAMFWAKSNFYGVPFHLMYQYFPEYRAVGDPVLGRPLNTQEINDAKLIAADLGLNLYAPTSDLPESASDSTDVLAGDFVDIRIHDDGRVSFHRLSGELLPIVQSFRM